MYSCSLMTPKILDPRPCIVSFVFQRCAAKLLRAAPCDDKRNHWRLGGIQVVPLVKGAGCIGFRDLGHDGAKGTEKGLRSIGVRK